MNWLGAIRDWLLIDDAEERPLSADSRAGLGDVLECRLVLSSLVADASTPIPAGTAPASGVGYGAAALSPTFSTDGSQSTDAGSTTATPLSPLPDLSTPPLSDGGQSQAATDPNSDSLQLTSGDGSTLAAATDDSSTSTSLESIVLPNGGNAADSQQLTTSADAPTTSVIDLATPSTPLTPVTTTNVPFAASSNTASTASSNTPSPPVAIDRALTAINRNVMVTSTQLAAAQSGGASAAPVIPAWFANPATAPVINYDFRDANGVTNTISTGQIQATEQVLQDWSAASGGNIQFVRDAQSDVQEIVNIGVGDLSAVGMTSGQGDILGTSVHALTTVSGSQTSVGTIWLDSSETWTNASPGGSASSAGNTTAGSVDFSTIMAHEVGHVLGLDGNASAAGIMDPNYSGPQDLSGIAAAYQNPHFFSVGDEDVNGFITDNMVAGQLSSGDVSTLLDRASVATPSNDAIIAIVDRNGNILGVRAEQDVLNTITDPATLAFAVDGAVSLARTAALFANNTAPITSRTIGALSQTTILQREVEANPNSADPTIQGPGFVAPVGIGGHFPANVEHTPPVDLFSIEASNRGSTTNPGMEAFNIDPANVPTGAELNALVSYGTASGVAAMASDVQNRGIATLPGGVPIYLDGELVGGIGVFFPGPDGYATHEQGFVAGVGQTSTQRTNTNQELEAEFIAFAALGGSPQAAAYGVSNAVIGTLGGIAPVAGTGLPFGFITLNGISLPLFGSTPGLCGLEDLIPQFIGVAGTGTLSGADQPLLGTAPGDTTLGGSAVPDGYLVTPHTSAGSTLTTADMTAIIDQGIAAANQVRAQLRINPSNSDTGAIGTRMTFAITDPAGNVLDLYRMQDGTIFSTDVAIAKARNVAYYDDPTQLVAQDQVATSPGGPDIAAGTAFTARTFRFLAEPRFPAGVDGSPPPQFSILNDAAAAGVNPETGENIGAPAAASAFTSVMGHDAFNPGTNFHDPNNLANQNGVVFFPGSMPLYKNGVLVGGLGVSGDGVNQDDLVTYLAAQGFLPNGTTIPTADETMVNGVRLPFQNFGRNPFA